MQQRSGTIQTISELIFANDLQVKADLIIVPGSSHKQLPLKAAHLLKKGVAKKIIFTGGLNQKLEENESDWGAKVAIKAGVAKKNILVESKSTNTKENALEALRVIKTNRLSHKKILLVSKPYHARRLKMTFLNIFTNSEFFVIPVVDDRKIEKNNWWKDDVKSQKVMEEVGKISEYYLKGDLSLK